MAQVKTNLNGQVVPFTIFVSGTTVAPNIRLDQDAWPDYVLASGIDDVPAYEARMREVFAECGADVSAITFEVL